MVEVSKAAVVPERHNKESSMNLEKAFTYFGIMNEVLKVATVPYRQNEEFIGDCQYNKK